MTIIEKLENLKNCGIARDTANIRDYSGFIYCLRAHGLLKQDSMKMIHSIDILNAFNYGNDSEVVMILAHYN